MTRMLKLLTPLFLLAIVFNSCKTGSEEPENMVALGGKKYGGEFNFMSSENIQTLFPLHGTDIYSVRISGQIFETLLRINSETMEVEPGLAESFDVNDDLTEYTFKIRNGVKFHENDCFKSDDERILTPEDVKFTLEYSISGMEENEFSLLLKDYVKGGNEFYEATKNGLNGKSVEGIQVKGENVVVSLNKPYAEFEMVLSNIVFGIVSKKAFEKYGKDIDDNPVGTGPFALYKKSDEGIDLKRNPDYWKQDEFGNQLPFLSAVHMTYSKNKRSQLDAFQKEEVDIVLEIPVDEVPFILGDLESAHLNVRHKVAAEKSLGMTYLGFAAQSEEFKDAKVRKAIDLAIDASYIIDNDLQGEGYYAENGIVPEMANYKSSEVKRVDFDVNKAKRLLAEAGYPNGRGFPKLEIYSNGLKGSLNELVVNSIAKQLKKNLNLDFTVKLCSLEDRDKAIESGEAKIWRKGWVADIPDAQNFLSLIYEGNQQNYSNEEFNQLFLAASAEVDSEKRNQMYIQCDQIATDEAVIIPILRGDHIVLINLRVRDFQTNPLQQMYLGETFIKELKVRVSDQDQE